LRSGWTLVLMWIALPLFGLALLTVLLELAFR
jgi:hypothetical protein